MLGRHHVIRALLASLAQLPGHFRATTARSVHTAQTLELRAVTLVLPALSARPQELRFAQAVILGGTSHRLVHRVA